MNLFFSLASLIIQTQEMAWDWGKLIAGRYLPSLPEYYRDDTGESGHHLQTCWTGATWKIFTGCLQTEDTGNYFLGFPKPYCS